MGEYGVRGEFLRVLRDGVDVHNVPVDAPLVQLAYGHEHGPSLVLVQEQGVDGFLHGERIVGGFETLDDLRADALQQALDEPGVFGRGDVGLGGEDPVECAFSQGLFQLQNKAQVDAGQEDGRW